MDNNTSARSCRGSARIATKRTAALVLFLAIAGCSNNDQRADAYGNFEATEVLISAETPGRLIEFGIDEGMRVEEDVVVGIIDTVQLSLQKSQLHASRRAVGSKLGEIAAQTNVLEEQRRVAQTERDRVERLLRDQAATTKQLDGVEGEIAVINRRIEQARAQRASVRSEIEALNAQIAQVDDQIDRSIITNPVRGTVLTKFVERHELVTPGKPLYKVADLSTMELRAYVSGAQLPHIRLGQEVEVQIDESRSANQSFQGEITWIADEAEFTPKLIQTKEERVNLVYAFKVRVRNADGVLKVGMPGEVWLGDASSTANGANP
ncbi:MAG: HlyD family efflux transporter periplasmic adaptor subunit [Rhodothermia bacterium]|nr:HlyD family efflux transporter periplasmic adaptor subunit [Rhodothermia bacterium]